MKNNTAPGTIAPLKFPEKFGFLTFSTASNVVYQFKSIYYLFFLTNILKIDVLVAGAILTIGTIWDAVNDPLIGFWSVNHKFKNGERCRPFALWFALPWAVSVVLLFCDFKTRRPSRLFWRLSSIFFSKQPTPSWPFLQQHGRPCHQPGFRPPLHQRVPQFGRMPRLWHWRRGLPAAFEAVWRAG